jgi:hypothetical protein
MKKIFFLINSEKIDHELFGSVTVRAIEDDL